MRTTEIGAWTPPIGVTPGMRRPVRTMTLAPISSRRMRLGLPTSSVASGASRAGLRPRRRRGDRVGRVVDDSVLGSTARLERKIESAELELDSDRIGSERADGLIE